MATAARNKFGERGRSANATTGHFAWLNQVKRDKGAGRNRLLVAFEIGQRFDSETGVCWPSHDTVGKAIGLTASAVKRVIRILAARGHLAIESRGLGRSCQYRKLAAPDDQGDLFDREAAPRASRSAGPASKNRGHQRSRSERDLGHQRPRFEQADLGHQRPIPRSPAALHLGHQRATEPLKEPLHVTTESIPLSSPPLFVPDETNAGLAASAPHPTNAEPVASKRATNGSAPIRSTETTKTRKGGNSAKRGSRIAPGWKPNSTDIASAERIGLTAARIELEAAKFVDHWLQSAQRTAIKIDWSAAWRNWCRNAIKFDEERARRAPGRRQESTREIIGRVAADFLAGDHPKGDDT
jgi:hypothetical protein